MCSVMLSLVGEQDPRGFIVSSTIRNRISIYAIHTDWLVNDSAFCFTVIPPLDSMESANRKYGLAFVAFLNKLIGAEHLLLYP